MRRLLVLLVLGCVLVARPAGAQDETEPTLTTEEPAYDRGQMIRVEGEGWPARTLLTVEVCGNEAANGSVDCDSRNATTAATGPDGTLFADVLASSPPSPCPCIVHVFTPGGTIDLGVRVRIEGVPETEVLASDQLVRQLAVTDIELSVDNRIATWFGFAPRTTLRATVTNVGDVAVPEAALRVRWGRSAPGNRSIDVDDLDELGPGESVDVEVPIRMDPLTLGRHVTSVDVAGFDGGPRTASMSTYPVLLILFVIADVVVLVALRIRRRRRGPRPARSRRPAVTPAAATPAVATPDAAPEADGDDDADAEAARRAIRVPVRAAAGLVVIGGLVATVLLARGCADEGSGGRLSPDRVCDELRAIDPGRSFAGESAEGLAVAATRVVAIQGRVPSDIAGAVDAIVAAVERDDAVLDLPDLAQDDDGYTAAYQAAYALRFDGEIAVAAALLERYAVDECGLEPSGAFDIDAVRDRDLDPADAPTLTQEEIEALQVEFTPADLEGHELEPFEIPVVEFDDDLGEFQLDVPEIPEPDLGP